MSIVPMKKVTLYGLKSEKKANLDKLQTIGCLHIIPLASNAADQSPLEGPSTQARKALKFLLNFKPRHHQIHNTEQFDPHYIEARCIEIMNRMHELNDEKDYLTKHISDLSPWGSFNFPQLDDVAQQRLWFYKIPHYLMHKLDNQDLTWLIVNEDNRFKYVVVIAQQEPHSIPVSRINTGHLSIAELKSRLEAINSELDDLQAERFSLTRWIDLFAVKLQHLEDKASLQLAMRQTLDNESIYTIQAWMPESKYNSLKKIVEHNHMVMAITDPLPDEQPPTLLQNDRKIASGQDLTTFYMTPGYQLWDPSAIVLFSFALFFSIILSDAGYALLCALFTGMFWRRLSKSQQGKRLRQLFILLSSSSLLWGIIAGSYFGIKPAPDSFMGSLHLIELNNMQLMMQITIILGVLHIIMANLVNAWQLRARKQSLASIGWVLVISSATFLWLESVNITEANINYLFYALIALGTFFILFFTSKHHSGWRRLLDGVLALTRVTRAFGDALSYLRLFALGLASASLAIAFNDLAKSVTNAAPAFGILAAILIIVIGHALNFMLAVVSGFVHGLRLNYIEFFHWSIDEEGYAFRAFHKKENNNWNT